MNDIQIQIETITSKDVFENNKVLYNTNNHWSTTGKAPDDYRKVLDKGLAKNWFHLKDDFVKTIDIDAKKHNWLLEANEIGLSTGKFPHAYDDELDELLKECNNTVFEEPLFVRTENVSLRFGQHGAGPYYNLKMVIQSLVSCVYTHTPFNKDDIGKSNNQNENIIRLYLFKWNDKISKNIFSEYRVFIYNKNVTCISQQMLYTPNDILKEKPQLAKKYAICLIEYFNENLKDNININSYTLDMAVIESYNGDQLNGYFIEVNSFGKDYAAGSSLFHWIIDNDKLCSDGKTVWFRYTV